MGKIKKWLHVLLLAVFLLSIMFPSVEKKVLQENTVLEDCSEILGITDKRSLRLSFPVKGEKICGVELYFCGKGNVSEGQVNYEVIGDNENLLAFGYLNVSDIISEKEGSLQVTSLNFDTPAKVEKQIEIILKGNQIPKNLTLGLYGNQEDSKGILVESGVVYIGKTPLYQIEEIGKSYSFTWDILLIWAIYLAIYSLRKNKENKG